MDLQSLLAGMFANKLGAPSGLPTSSGFAGGSAGGNMLPPTAIGANPAPQPGGVSLGPVDQMNGTGGVMSGPTMPDTSGLQTGGVMSGPTGSMDLGSLMETLKGLGIKAQGGSGLPTNGGIVPPADSGLPGLPGGGIGAQPPADMGTGVIRPTDILPGAGGGLTSPPPPDMGTGTMGPGGVSDTSAGPQPTPMPPMPLPGLPPMQTQTGGLPPNLDMLPPKSGMGMGQMGSGQVMPPRMKRGGMGASTGAMPPWGGVKQGGSSGLPAPSNPWSLGKGIR